MGLSKKVKEAYKSSLNCTCAEHINSELKNEGREPLSDRFEQNVELIEKSGINNKWVYDLLVDRRWVVLYT